MRSHIRPRLSLSSRIILFLLLFGLGLLMQLLLWWYQSESILRPTQERIETIQTISQFLADTGKCVTALDNYRWEFDDQAALVSKVTAWQNAAASQLERIHADPGEAGETYCLLTSAVETSAGYFTARTHEICEALASGQKESASRIWYEKTASCGSWLQRYTRELLEQAILDNHDAFTAMNTTNARLRNMQVVTMLLTIGATALLIHALISLLHSMLLLSRAAEQINCGNLDIPDVDAGSGDEIGHLTATFNEMRRSMKQQMQLLQEKNAMERELYTRKNEALAMRNTIETGKLQLLRSQIHPHFLCNTLNVITYTARQEGASETEALIISLSRLFRYTLWSNAASFPLSQEKRIVDDFYSLYHARFGDRLRLTWKIDPDVDLTETMIPSFLIQPLVENAFRHGLAPKEEGGSVEIEVRAMGDVLEITVSDDGVGMSADALESLRSALSSLTPGDEHIGLYNVAARLTLSGRTEGLEIQSEEGMGTIARMRLPLLVMDTGKESEDEDEENSGCGR